MSPPSHVFWPLAAVEGVEQSAVQHSLKPAPQAFQVERVSRNELNLDPPVGGLLPGDRQLPSPPRRSPEPTIPAKRREERSRRPAARIEHRSGESAFGCQTPYCWLRPANIPRRWTVVVRRIPGQSRHSFVTGWVPTTERIVIEGS